MNGSAFRGFASKLREHAKDAVGNYKLPNFDDMAERDEYIHSPEFNVRGRTTTREAAPAGESSSPPPNAEREHSTTYSLNVAGPDEASYYSTESSWSLLDRPPNHTISVPISSGNEIQQTRVATISMSIRDNPRGVYDGQTEDLRSSGPILPSEQQRDKHSSVSLLSVVSDTLPETVPLATDAPLTNSGGNYVIAGSGTQTPDYMESVNDSCQSSEGSYDEEDPILSMIQKDFSGQNRENAQNGDGDAPTPVITIQKPSNRFMEDARLQTPLHQDQTMEALTRMSITPAAAATTEAEISNINASGQFGGYFKTMALSNLNRIKLGLSMKNSDNKQQLPPPPLARERTPKPAGQQPPMHNFESTTSAGMLGEKDLQQLRQLKVGRSTATILAASVWKEHKDFLFIAFTLVLSIFVYFRTRKNIEDDVT